MLSNELEVIAHALAWRQAGYRAALVTVLSTFGSSPRPAGSMAVIREDGMIAGSVSGGCVEDDLARAVRQASFWTQAVVVKTFGADAEERARYRLPCGNSLRVAIETQWDAAILSAAQDEVLAGRTVLRLVDYGSGVSRLQKATSATRFSDTVQSFGNLLGPRYRLLIIGAAELGAYLAQIALTLDFAITVCDPRREYLDAWQIAGVTLSTSMPDDLVLEFSCDLRTAVVAVSHDPKLDDLALMEALRTPAFYVGALGSTTTNERRRQRLTQFSLDAAEVVRMKGPVGINIGSRTPAEIAVSIAAELIKERRRLEQGAQSAVERVCTV